jgi:superfamily II DNA/RNA helicase
LPSIEVLNALPARRNENSEDERIEINSKQKIHANIIIATPGRLAHLLGTNTLCVKKLDVFILDEADR